MASGAQDQTRIATALSEIARNALGYAGGGKVDFLLRRGARPSLVVRVRDSGKGIENLSSILEGRYVSPTGMGLGIAGARRLMDTLEVQTAPTGTTVTMDKAVPGAIPLLAKVLPVIADAVRALRSGDPGTMVRDENRDLVESLAALTEREEEAKRLNAELESTNRGVVALHADLERQAEELRRAGETLERQVAERTRELAEANARLLAEADMRERVEADLRQSQKMEAVGQLTGGIAHDFNNLLTGVIGALDLMGRRHKEGRHDKIETYIEMALASANRAAALTHRLLAFARRQPLDPKIVDVNALIGAMSDLLRRSVNEQIELRFRPGCRCLDHLVRSVSAGKRDPQPGDQRAGRHADRRLDHRGDAQPDLGRPLRRPAPLRPATTSSSASPTTAPACRRTCWREPSIPSSRRSRWGRVRALGCP